MRLRLSAEAWATVGDHAERAYPHEACGILLGRLDAWEALEAHPCKNLNSERAHDRYLLDPQDQLKIEKDARARGLDLLGYYHSHPDHPADASATDEELSWEGVAYLIVSVSHGDLADQRAWGRSAGAADKRLQRWELELPA